MANDLGKPETEAWLTDVAAVRKDVLGIRNQLEAWAAPRPAKVPWTLRPGHAEVVPEPLGTVLVIGPWNYPISCLVLPLAFALAAGNTAAAKPSELAPRTSATLARLMRAYLDGQAVAVVEGGPEVAEALLAQRWDHIFFTGGGRVGRLVMAAAARNLTPVTLELGGKNPALIDGTADLSVAARRIAWGKFLNAGQSCVAPDYALVDRQTEGQFVEQLVRWLRHFYGPDPRASRDFGRIVSDAHFQRLLGLLQATKARVVTGASAEPAERYLAPTILASLDWADAVMDDEIFGPILPVLTFDDPNEAISAVNGRDKPLALYLYSQDAALAQRVIDETSSGSVCINHNAVQLAVPALPFGGVGASGMGAYNGRTGFDTFSHTKAVLRRPARGELPLMYPPYTRAKRWLLRKVL